MSLLAHLLRRPDGRAPLTPLYGAIVAHARQPHWYVEGGVADTLDGRFEMVATVLALVLLRLERDSDRRREAALLAEIFVEDMDGQLRELGVGDLMVGKHVGKMMGALGGRLSAYRAAFEGDGDLEGALRRNLYRGEAVDDAALAHGAAALRRLRAALDSQDAGTLLAGNLPR